MNIRKIQVQELLPALHLAAEVFAEDVAPAYTEEGVANFHEFISYDSFRTMFERGEVAVFGAFEGVQICAMIAVTNTGHISLFFVRKPFQRHGIGKLLYHVAVAYCMREIRCPKITVNAAPQAVEAYEHLGMHKIAEEQESDGIRYVPMEADLVQTAYSSNQNTEHFDQGAYQYHQNPTQNGPQAYSYGQQPGGTYGQQLQRPGKRSSWPVVVGIALVVVLIVVAIGGAVLFGGFIYHKAKEDVGITNEAPYDDDGDWDDDWDDDTDDYGDNSDQDNGTQTPAQKSDASGIDQIEAYKAKGLPYQIKDKTYSFRDSEKQSTIIDFNVVYPQLSGKNQKQIKKINSVIEKCAMSTVNAIYTHPSEDIKQKVIEAQTPALISYVKCKVSYASDDFISIVFEDTSARGEYSEYQTDLRTLNIRLSDGKVYEVKDVVRLDEKFLSDWVKEMRDETDDNSFLSELNTEQMKQALEGKNELYEPNFFVDEEGMEIGFNMNVSDSAKNTQKYAWVTAPYDFDEIEPYIADQGFFQEVHR